MFRANEKPNFLGKAAPAGYVAGIGRGATGFTTRSDIGPARSENDLTISIDRDGRMSYSQRKKFEEEQKKQYQAQLFGASVSADAASAGAERGGGGGQEGEGDDDVAGDDGDDAGLFANMPYTQEDEEADAIYDAIDDYMEGRRQKRREERERQEMIQARKERPRIQQQFTALKRGLAQVTAEEWAAIPDIGDYRAKKQQKRQEKFTPLSDALLAKAHQDKQYATSIDTRDGLMTSSSNGTESILADFAQIGEARGAVLGAKLDRISDSLSGQTNIDPKGYLTSLDSVMIKSNAEIGDIKKARLLLKSITTTNPKNAQGWIAAARLEEIAGKTIDARDMISRGCHECPSSEDVWLEAARLNHDQNAKVILAEAVRYLPYSLKIWLYAAGLETDVRLKKRVLRRAIELIPSSVKLWKTAVELEQDEEDARIMLTRAVECVPDSVELWLALARLETQENARKVLNQARLACPTSRDIWVAAAKLEEASGSDPDRIGKLVARAVRDLSTRGVTISREEWMNEAEQCEATGCVLTAQTIIKEIIASEVDPEDRKRTWMDDAEAILSRGHIMTARAVYEYALNVFPNKKSLWLAAARLEKAHGTRDSLDQLLQKAVMACPKAEVLWLMAAKEQWISGNVQQARQILQEAFKVNANSEQIVLAAVKLESETGEFERARGLLSRARQQADTPRVWMKSVTLERYLGDVARAIDYLQVALQKYPKFGKLWMIKGQLSEQTGDVLVARSAYKEGSQHCPSSIPLWLLSARLEEKEGVFVRARALLETARKKNPQIPELWLEATRVELRAKNKPAAQSLMSAALQECPKSGILWAESIFMEARPQRMSRGLDALKRTDNDPFVVCAVARVFWDTGKIDKARSWFQKAVELNPDVGDFWAYYYKFEIQHGTHEQQEEVLNGCSKLDPRHGELWTTIIKSVNNFRKSTPELLKLAALKAPLEIRFCNAATV